MISNLGISKACSREEWELIQQIDERYVPPNIAWKNDLLTYDYVDGVAPVDWRTVHEAAQIAIWAGEPKLGINCRAYEWHVLDVTPDIWKHDVNNILKSRLGGLTSVRACHGDLTLYNCVQQGKDIYFLDPSPARGLPCVELDESKMLQSLDGFGVVFRGLPQPLAWPKMRTRPVHWALLLTHYIRLLKHVKHKGALGFANQRIRELICLLR
jgi:hypothetical protein